jgi:competence ComEA-like helix-hairpin-helix protein
MNPRHKTAPAARRRALSESIISGVLAVLWIISIMLVIVHLRPHPDVPRWIIRRPRAAAMLPARPTIVLPQGEISVNTAGPEELMKLPGVGPVLAEAIISERQQNGFFYYPEDLLNVRGIGEKTLEKILPYVNLQ